MKRPHWTERKPRTKKYKLDRNETYDTFLHKHITDFLHTLSADTVTQYPDISSAYYSLENITQIPHSNLFLTSGAEHAIRAVLSVNTEHKKIHMPSPTFELADIYSRLLGIKVCKIPYKYTGLNFDIDFPSKPKNSMLYIASPDNPTGYRYAPSALKLFCEQYSVVILDETYCHHDQDKLDVVESYENLYVIRTFSKFGAAAGLRVGYIISNKSNIDRLYMHRPMYEINSIGCEYLKYMSSKHNILKESHDNIYKGKTVLENWLTDNNCTVINNGGNFVLCIYDERMAQKLDKFVAYKKLIIDGIKLIRITAPSQDCAEQLINDVS